MNTTNTDDQHAAPAEDVPRPATEQQQPAERQAVGVDHPGQACRREVQRRVDLGNRDVDHRGIEYHHELAGDDDGQRDPGVPSAGGIGVTTGFPNGCGHWAISLRQ